MRCKDCVYWSPFTSISRHTESGQCRFNPPTVVYNEEHYSTCDWPSTGSLDWCGKFKEK